MFATGWHGTHTNELKYIAVFGKNAKMHTHICTNSDRSFNLRSLRVYQQR